MSPSAGSFSNSPEALVVGLARTGDRSAFAELVRRRQSWVRKLMRRFSGDATLADDLAQQVFLQAWRDIARIREPKRFGAWLKRLTLNIWLKHQRVKDPLRGADEDSQSDLVSRDSPDISMDLERALATLSNAARLCVVLSYHEGMSHGEIAELVELPLGTVKSHIRRATGQLREMLSAYSSSPGEQK